MALNRIPRKFSILAIAPANPMGLPDLFWPPKLVITFAVGLLQPLLWAGRKGGNPGLWGGWPGGGKARDPFGPS